MKKKILCLLLALVMTVGLLPLSAMAADDTGAEPAALTAEEDAEETVVYAEDNTDDDAALPSEQDGETDTPNDDDTVSMTTTGLKGMSSATITEYYNDLGDTSSNINYAAANLKDIQDDSYTADFKWRLHNSGSTTRTFVGAGVAFSRDAIPEGYTFAGVKVNGVQIDVPRKGTEATYNYGTIEGLDFVQVSLCVTTYNKIELAIQIPKGQGNLENCLTLWNYIKSNGLKTELIFEELSADAKVTFTDGSYGVAKHLGKLESGEDEWSVSAVPPTVDKVFQYWTWTSESDPTGNDGEQITDKSFTVQLTESRVYTAHYFDAFKPVVTTADSSKGKVGDVVCTSANTKRSVWKVTGNPASDWYKLDYVENASGKQFKSSDGKTASITVTEADQAFTAYFTANREPMYDESKAESVTINMTVSNDGIPLLGADGETVLAHKDITVPYFDLANYGLDKYYRYGTEYGWGNYSNETVVERPTALHAYIYILERYYLGLPESECGTGKSGVMDYNKSVDVKYFDEGTAFNSNRKYALTISGDATSLYMYNFWGHDQNLMYFRNHEYPLMGKGWGSTADYILLSDGDRLDVAMFTNWSFYRDGGFNQFSKDEYTALTGETVTTSTFKAGTSAGLDGESPELEAISGLKVAIYDADWNKVADVEGDGTYSYTFDKAGTYYFAAFDANARSARACYAPATAKVTVMDNKDGYFMVEDTDDLLWLQRYVNTDGHYDAKVALANDIDMTGIEWQGLGDDSIISDAMNDTRGYNDGKAFTGVIDGRGHKLTVNFESAPLVNMLAGTVKDLTIEGQSTAGSIFTRYLLKGGQIEDCANRASLSGAVNAGSEKAASPFAAIVYHMIGAEPRATVITGCENYGAIDANGYVGGMIGTIVTYFPSSLADASKALSVTDCVNYGEITSNGYVGGIVGRSNMSATGGLELKNCENHAAIGSTDASYAGGIMGYNGTGGQVISGCLNTGDIKAMACGGGIAATSGDHTGLIELCVNTGYVTGGTAAGIIASSNGDIENCYNTGEVFAKGTAGGIVGTQTIKNIPNTYVFTVGKIENCYTTGKVSVPEGNSWAYAGAAVGKLHTGWYSADPVVRSCTIYALEGTCDKLVGQLGDAAKDNTAFKTEEELKSDDMLALLGEAFIKDEDEINNGYPILSWQVTPITGLVNIDGQIMYYTDGELDTSVTGVARLDDGSDSNWYYVENGIFKEATGIAQRADGSNNNWYYVENGIYKKATGIARYADGSSKNWYYVEKGQYTKATGIARYADGSSKDWYYVQNGKYTKATGIAQYADGSSNNWYYVQNGKYTKATGITQKADGSSKNWYYVSGGRYRPDYTGLAPRIPDGKLFYVKGGVYRNNFNGTVKYQGKTYTVKNGRAV